MKLLVRAAMLGLGVWLLIMGWQTASYPVYYRLTGTVVEGKSSAFWPGGSRHPYSRKIPPSGMGIASPDAPLTSTPRHQAALLN
ncbi:MAG: hypothetical protein HZT40_15590 [Candidatus Thiothrix singaporensis]|uniref:Uncharacterized protein n=1 Tax=Candidatus Thiothrix singaporensis TaxID=2799669 RepID=A0A7L6AUJ6_9GAMM|nr:MAG: hypothetical protein HZT40_15590 [Candidatus Thiothrix singaporensis]